jgi:hypothetical protein
MRRDLGSRLSNKQQRKDANQHRRAVPVRALVAAADRNERTGAVCTRGPDCLRFAHR